MLGTKSEAGEGLSPQEIKELEEKLRRIEETDAGVKAMFGEVRKAPAKKKQKNNLVEEN